MNLRQWKKWEKLRKNGKTNFIILYGGLVVGFFLALIVTLISLIFDPEPYWGIRLMINFPIFSLISLIAAVFIWNIRETKFMSTNPPEHRRIKHSSHKKHF